jgi:hypothetical protein
MKKTLKLALSTIGLAGLIFVATSFPLNSKKTPIQTQNLENIAKQETYSEKTQLQTQLQKSAHYPQIEEPKDYFLTIENQEYNLADPQNLQALISKLDSYKSSDKSPLSPFNFLISETLVDAYLNFGILDGEINYSDPQANISLAQAMIESKKYAEASQIISQTIPEVNIKKAISEKLEELVTGQSLYPIIRPPFPEPEKEYSDLRENANEEISCAVDQMERLILLRKAKYFDHEDRSILSRLTAEQRELYNMQVQNLTNYLGESILSREIPEETRESCTKGILELVAPWDKFSRSEVSPLDLSSPNFDQVYHHICEAANKYLSTPIPKVNDEAHIVFEDENNWPEKAAKYIERNISFGASLARAIETRDKIYAERLREEVSWRKEELKEAFERARSMNPYNNSDLMRIDNMIISLGY